MFSASSVGTPAPLIKQSA